MNYETEIWRTFYGYILEGNVNGPSFSISNKEANFVPQATSTFFFSFSASEHSLVLKEIKVPLWSHNTCDFALQAQFGPAHHLPNTAVCAGAEGRDACDVSSSIWTHNHNVSVPI